MDYEYCVFIGRFQPFHNSHLEVLKQALEVAQKVIVIVGSANAAPNIKNPWTTQERMGMINACLTKEESRRIVYAEVRDYFYNENFWVTNIQQKVAELTDGSNSIAITGTYKDSSSYYIKLFPQWDFVPAKSHSLLNATEVRNDLFGQVADRWKKNIPSPVAEMIVGWMRSNFGAKRYENLVEEFKFIQDYKEKSKFKGHPWAPVFTTVDTILIQSGHVLVVKRKFNPGKGLIALPGGFLKENENLKSAAIRELKEETGIKVSKTILEANIVDSRVFDHPDRSLRGRTITHAFCIKLPEGELPEVKGSDDAAKAFWMPLMDVVKREEEFYEDHMHIINYFVSKS